MRPETATRYGVDTYSGFRQSRIPADITPGACCVVDYGSIRQRTPAVGPGGLKLPSVKDQKIIAVCENEALAHQIAAMMNAAIPPFGGKKYR